MSKFVGVDYGLRMPIQPSGISYVPSDMCTFLKPSEELLTEIRSARMMQIVAISDVKILSHDKVVQVIFADGTSEKAVCSENDTFSLETGITVCIAKKLLGGTKEYNKTIRNALKTMEQKEKNRKDLEERNKRIVLKQKKEAEKRRERKIKLQEEAYYRAMKRIEQEKNTQG